MRTSFIAQSIILALQATVLVAMQSPPMNTLERVTNHDGEQQVNNDTSSKAMMTMAIDAEGHGQERHKEHGSNDKNVNLGHSSTVGLWIEHKNCPLGVIYGSDRQVQYGFNEKPFSEFTSREQAKSECADACVAFDGVQNAHDGAQCEFATLHWSTWGNGASCWFHNSGCGDYSKWAPNSYALFVKEPYTAIGQDKRCARSSQIQRWAGPTGKSKDQCYEACVADSTCVYFAAWPASGQPGAGGRNDCRIYQSPCDPQEDLLGGYHNTIYEVKHRA